MSFLYDPLARLLAVTPDCVRSLICEILGRAFFAFSRRRRRLILSNLSHAFPEAGMRQLRSWGATSTVRMVEMGMLSLCAAYIAESSIQQRLTIDSETETILKENLRQNRAAVVLVPHFTSMAMMPWLPVTAPIMPPERFACFYRPLSDPKLDTLITAGRTRFGKRFLSRRDGLNQGMQYLREGGTVCILFDQNVRDAGVATLFFNRICTATDFPGLMVKKFSTDLLFAYIERTGFWRGCYRTIRLENHWRQSPLHVTVGAQQTLEKILRHQPHLIPDWLWSHNRWKALNEPRERLCLAHKKVRIRETMTLTGLAELPKTLRIAIRLPESADFQSALEAIALIPRSRPDAHLTLVGSAVKISAASAQGIGHAWIQPTAIDTLAAQFIDTLILFHHESREVGKWKRLRCPQVFGIQPDSSADPSLYTHTWRGADDAEGSGVYLLALRHFGLNPHAAPL